MTLGEWCDENGEYGDKLLEEWYDPDRTVEEVTRGNRVYKALWRCSAGCTKDGEAFTWEATVGHRTNSERPRGCPGCARKSPTDQNNLLQWCQDNGEHGRKLIEEWAEPTLAMKDVMPGSTKKLSWRCLAGCTEDGEPFTWEARVYDRTGSKHHGCTGCPGCSPSTPISLQKRLGKVAR